MGELKYTLIGDGSSDKALINIINWLLNDLYPKMAIRGEFADFREFKDPPKIGDIQNQIKYAKYYYPFDILFYHRDGESNEKGIIGKRKSEIFSNVNNEIKLDLLVCVVPIVMMESWLLFDLEAIKKAAGNRKFAGNVELPKMKDIENKPNTKLYLHNILKRVSCKKGRSLDKFNLNYAVHLIAENIEDFSKLRELSSFIEFQNDLKKSVDKFNFDKLSECFEQPNDHAKRDKF